MIFGRTNLICIALFLFGTIECFGQLPEQLSQWPGLSANLSVVASKDSLTVGECFVLTMSFNVGDGNRVPLRFTELEKTIYDISSNDFKRSGWLVGDSQINEVVETSKYEGFTTYEIL